MTVLTHCFCLHRSHTPSPTKLGAFERKCIDESLVLALQIVNRLLPANPLVMPILAKIFDPTPSYYAGTKVSWNQYAGFPQVRIGLTRKFAEMGGFGNVLAVLKDPEAQWLGAETLGLLVKALCECIGQVPDDVREELVATVAKSLLTLSDEHLKRENTEHLHALIRALGHAYMW